ncbi:hypothetical protein V6N12_044470 [Hibiscus sabdariffa]|uniref:Uncharacterized protein n=1 Tax=Hibiscus sabdariffa TaxID=183260 RepID=A0ABR2BNG8_9ROSI
MLGSLSNEDDLCWFSSSQMTEGSQDAFKADAKLNGAAQHCAGSRPDYAVSSTIDSNKKSVHSSDKIGSRNMKDENASFAHMSFLNVSYEEFEIKDELKLIEQTSLPKKQSKELSASGEIKDQALENGGSFHQYGNIKQSANVKHTFTVSACQFFSPSSLQHHKQNVGSDSVSYIQTNIPYMHLDYISPLDQILECPTLSSTKSENNGNCSSTNESSYASDKMYSIESSSGPSFGASAIIMNEKRGKLHYQQDTHAPLKRNVKHAKVGRKPTELDSLNDQLSSCMSTVLDEVSPASTDHGKGVLNRGIIRQIQKVTSKMKRMGLVRLWLKKPTSASVGANYILNLSKIFIWMVMPGYVLDTGCSGLTNMETDTNPIDRSVAHLLFHRPSGPTMETKYHGMRPQLGWTKVNADGAVHCRDDAVVVGEQDDKSDTKGNVIHEPSAAAPEEKTMVNVVQAMPDKFVLGRDMLGEFAEGHLNSGMALMALDK